MKIVLQWIPSHCGIEGNEQADRKAKLGAKNEQEEKAVSSTEMKTIIKSLLKKHPMHDSYEQPSRPDQVTIFRLRTGHNRLHQDLHKNLRAVPAPMCPCGEGEQDAAHILQDFRNIQSLRSETWSRPTPLQDKCTDPWRLCRRLPASSQELESKCKGGSTRRTRR
ncbi:hypothetical protein V1264_016747 [Littorina saxatilis]|uniref:RNase H type-1 domain-containing protein n=1 Tax=Littorina saxatilis TaxID=31220 RepID=A0AAN9BI45_9CAEN